MQPITRATAAPMSARLLRRALAAPWLVTPGGYLVASLAAPGSWLEHAGGVVGTVGVFGCGAATLIAGVAVAVHRLRGFWST